MDGLIWAARGHVMIDVLMLPLRCLVRLLPFLTPPEWRGWMKKKMSLIQEASPILAVCRVEDTL